MHLRRLLLIPAALVGLACNNPPDGPSDPPAFRITPQRQWSGGEITITSQDFVDLPANLIVRFDTATVPVIRPNDSTILVSVPPGSSGDLSVSVAGYDAGTVSRVGFRETSMLSVGAVLSISDFPGGPVGLGVTTAGNMGMWDLTSGQFTPLPAFSNFGNFAMAPSYRGPTYATARDTSDALVEWQLWPVVQPIDTIPPARVTAVLGPDDYLLGRDNRTTTIVDGVSRDFEGAEAERAFLSTAAGRVLVSASTIQGVPVFHISTGDSAYHVPLRLVYGAVFTRDGARLHLVGSTNRFPSDRLLTVDAATGAILSEDSLPPGTQGFDLAMDLSESYLFVAADSGGTSRVIVLEAQTLKRIGTLIVPEEAPSWSFTGRVAVDESAESIYLVMSGDPLPVYRFDLLR